jgi:arginyl-tRNA synthetase
MHSLEHILSESTIDAITTLYNGEVNREQIQFQKTRKEFKGDITLVVFPFLRISKKAPEDTGKQIGEELKLKLSIVKDFNTVKGFLNLEINNSYYLQLLNENFSNENFGKTAPTESSKLVMVEYSSPNTNKPLHLGHIRNNLLGHSVCEILEANGNRIVKTNIVNDRGIHICKSMLAWQKMGNGETPQSSGLKGDHLVGKYYVLFDKEYKKQINELVEKGTDADEAKKQAPILLEAQELLRKWEAKDPETLELWKTMNAWVYDGFDVTYDRLGVTFDKIYYESDTYLSGRDTVLEGLKANTFYQRDDNSVWADLTKDGLDEKILLRSDGTSVYMTQDIGTAQLRQNDFGFDQCIYVVGNEQDYHFKVLSIILDKLGFAWAKDLYHLSYGMVELPEGKMKSREGTVVDADDLMDEMIKTAEDMSKELGKLDAFSEDEKKDIYRRVGLGALKYFILKVDPKKNMTFNPKESVDFNGNTGPFIQYTYARIRSILRKANEDSVSARSIENLSIAISEKEKSLLKLLYYYPEAVAEAGKAYAPSVIANYAYDLAKEYNQFYHDHTILKESNEETKNVRLQLSEFTGNVLKSALHLLGIEMPERM